MKQRLAYFVYLSVFNCAMATTLFAQGILALEAAWLPPIQQSTAYQQFSTRPYSELSKILYLIDRFGDTNVQILYDGHYYNPRFVKGVARWFLLHHYNKEKAEQFVIRWCNKTVLGGNLIWVKLPDGSSRLARDVLLEELKSLDEVHIQKLASKVSVEVTLPEVKSSTATGTESAKKS